MKMPAELIARVDEWRNSQPVAPPRAAAVRRLLELALDGLEQSDPAAKVALRLAT